MRPSYALQLVLNRFPTGWLENCWRNAPYLFWGSFSTQLSSCVHHWDKGMGVGSFENMGGTVINSYTNTKAAVSQHGDKNKKQQGHKQKANETQTFSSIHE